MKRIFLGILLGLGPLSAFNVSVFESWSRIQNPWGLEISHRSSTYGLHEERIALFGFPGIQPGSFFREWEVSYGFETLSYDPETENPIAFTGHRFGALLGIHYLSHLRTRLAFDADLLSAPPALDARMRVSLMQSVHWDPVEIGIRLGNLPEAYPRFFLVSEIFANFKIGKSWELGARIHQEADLETSAFAFSQLVIQLDALFRVSPLLAFRLGGKIHFRRLEVRAGFELSSSKTLPPSVFLDASIDQSGIVRAGLRLLIGEKPPPSLPDKPAAKVPSSFIIAPLLNQSARSSLDYLTEVFPGILADRLGGKIPWTRSREQTAANVVDFHRGREWSDVDGKLSSLLRGEFGIRLILIPSLEMREKSLFLKIRQTDTVTKVSVVLEYPLAGEKKEDFVLAAEELARQIIRQQK